MKQITDTQHLALTYTNLVIRDNKGVLHKYRRYAKPGETQDKAVKRFMTALKRDTRRPGPEVFPLFRPGMTTQEYIRKFADNGGRALHYDMSKYNRPAPVLDTSCPEVTYEAI